MSINEESFISSIADIDTIQDLKLIIDGLEEQLLATNKKHKAEMESLLYENSQLKSLRIQTPLTIREFKSGIGGRMLRFNEKGRQLDDKLIKCKLMDRFSMSTPLNKNGNQSCESNILNSGNMDTYMKETNSLYSQNSSPSQNKADTLEYNDLLKKNFNFNDKIVLDGNKNSSMIPKNGEKSSPEIFPKDELINELENKIDNKNEEIQTLSNELNAAKLQLKEKDESLENLKKSMADIESAMGAMSVDIFDKIVSTLPPQSPARISLMRSSRSIPDKQHKAKILREKDELNASKETINWLQNNLNSAHEENKKLNDIITCLKNESDKLKLSMDIMEKELNEEKLNMKEMKEQLNESKLNICTFSLELQNKEKSLELSLTENENMKVRISDLEREIKVLSVEVEKKFSDEANFLKSNNLKISTSLELAESQKNKLMLDNEKLNLKLHDLEKENIRLYQILQTLEQKSQGTLPLLAEEIDQVSNQFKIYEEMFANLRDTNEELRLDNEMKNEEIELIMENLRREELRVVQVQKEMTLQLMGKEEKMSLIAEDKENLMEKYKALDNKNNALMAEMELELKKKEEKLFMISEENENLLEKCKDLENKNINLMDKIADLEIQNAYTKSMDSTAAESLQRDLGKISKLEVELNISKAENHEISRMCEELKDKIQKMNVSERKSLELISDLQTSRDLLISNLSELQKTENRIKFELMEMETKKNLLEKETKTSSLVTSNTFKDQLFEVFKNYKEYEEMISTLQRCNEELRNEMEKRNSCQNELSCKIANTFEQQMIEIFKNYKQYEEMILNLKSCNNDLRKEMEIKESEILNTINTQSELQKFHLENQELKDQLVILQGEVKTSGDLLLKCNDEIESLRDINLILEDKLTKASSANESGLEGKDDKLRSDIIGRALAEDEKNLMLMFENTLKAFEPQLCNVFSKYSQYEEMILNLKSCNDDLRLEMERRNAQFKSLSAEISLKSENLKEILKEKEDLKEKCRNFEDKNNHLTSKIADLEIQQAYSKSIDYTNAESCQRDLEKISKLEIELKIAKSELIGINRTCEDFKEKVQNFKIGEKNFLKLISELQQTRDKLIENMSDLQKAEIGSQQKISNLHNKILELTENNRNLYNGVTKEADKNKKLKKYLDNIISSLKNGKVTSSNTEETLRGKEKILSLAPVEIVKYYEKKLEKLSGLVLIGEEAIKLNADYIFSRKSKNKLNNKENEKVS